MTKQARDVALASMTTRERSKEAAQLHDEAAHRTDVVQRPETLTSTNQHHENQNPEAQNLQSPAPRRHGRWDWLVRVVNWIFTDDLTEGINQIPDHQRAREHAMHYRAFKDLNR